MAFAPTDQEMNDALWCVARRLQLEKKRLETKRNTAFNSNTQFECDRSVRNLEKWIDALCALYKERTNQELRVYDVG